MTEQNKLGDFRPMEQNVAYIGEGVSIKGEISVPDVIVVDGTVEGDLTARSIRIGPSGVIKGNIVATDADVHGSITEKLEVKQLMILRATARVQGNVSYGELQIEKGAVISGELASTDFRPERKAGKPEPAPPGKVERLKLTVGAGGDASRAANAEPGRLPNVASAGQTTPNVSNIPVVDLADLKATS